MMRWSVVLLVIAATPSRAVPVPFVGCAMDGQGGPVAAAASGATPDVPAAAAARLAYYGTDGVAKMGVLAPRGWHCFATYGSNGSSLAVTPGPIGWEQMTGKTGLRGPGVQLRYAVGDTSGRFEVAAIAARLFPAARAYVAGIEGEGLLPKPFDRRPFAGDRITRHGAYDAMFTTPGGKAGLGTQSILAPDSQPIDGAAILYPKDDMSLRMLVVRLAPADRSLAATIVAAMRAER